MSRRRSRGHDHGTYCAAKNCTDLTNLQDTLTRLLEPVTTAENLRRARERSIT